MSRRQSKIQTAELELRDFALTYPESHEDWPWGHRAIKVRNKIFLTVNVDDDGFHMSCKLPISNTEALAMPFTEPTHYGMGKHGWVTANFDHDGAPPTGLFKQWIDESFRAIAPKTLVKQLPADGVTAAPKRKKAAKKTAKKTTAKTTKKKTAKTTKKKTG